VIQGQGLGVTTLEVKVVLCQPSFDRGTRHKSPVERL
jgi:hypothetical protein